tara:strand:+ start:565 stop:696 length:132 start_codon:yes stop_codon:yes gene_type:complete
MIPLGTVASADGTPEQYVTHNRQFAQRMVKNYMTRGVPGAMDY